MRGNLKSNTRVIEYEYPLQTHYHVFCSGLNSPRDTPKVKLDLMVLNHEDWLSYQSIKLFLDYKSLLSSICM